MSVPDWSELLRLYMRDRVMPLPAEGREDAKSEA